MLSSKNTFKPYVLAKVSWNGRGSVGSSIAVSAFLRPLCLYQRIMGFKPRLKEAVVFAKPLLSPSDDKAMKSGWSCKAYTDGGGSDQATGASSTAFNKTEPYDNYKDPCKKCRNVFKNLGGFIHVRDPYSAGGDRSFWGACAEYCPVNDLIPGGNGETPPQMSNRLEKYHEQCFSLFTDLCKFSYELDANKEPDDEKQLQVAAKALVPSTKIFGFRPHVECGSVMF